MECREKSLEESPKKIVLVREKKRNFQGMLGKSWENFWEKLERNVRRNFLEILFNAFQKKSREKLFQKFLE